MLISRRQISHANRKELQLALFIGYDIHVCTERSNLKLFPEQKSYIFRPFLDGFTAVAVNRVGVVTFT